MYLVGRVPGRVVPVRRRRGQRCRVSVDRRRIIRRRDRTAIVAAEAIVLVKHIVVVVVRRRVVVRGQSGHGVVTAAAADAITRVPDHGIVQPVVRSRSLVRAHDVRVVIVVRQYLPVAARHLLVSVRRRHRIVSHHTATDPVRRRPPAGPVYAAQPRRATVTVLFLRQLLFAVSVHVVRLNSGGPL